MECHSLARGTGNRPVIGQETLMHWKARKQGHHIIMLLGPSYTYRQINLLYWIGMGLKIQFHKLF